MLTDVLSAQSFGGFGCREPDLDVRMASDISNLYGAHDGWRPPPQDNNPGVATANYMHHTMPFTTIPTTTAPLNFDPTNAYSVPLTFTASNATPQNQHGLSLSPVQTRFNPSETSPQSYSSSSFDHSNAHVATNFSEPSSENQEMTSAQSHDNSSTMFQSHSPTLKRRSVGRRRKSELTEIGSARAIYLEKNRKAASKCRNKQKRQQEDLIEEARNTERRNRVLKAEVEMLRGDVHDLMDIVGLHANCPDSRLRLYVQREADRLATGYTSVPQIPHSSKTSPGAPSPPGCP
jgi:cyclic AMP-dependent transcription factor ATF-2